jgi:hypothetical protein
LRIQVRFQFKFKNRLDSASAGMTETRVDFQFHLNVSTFREFPKRENSLEFLEFLIERWLKRFERSKVFERLERLELSVTVERLERASVKGEGVRVSKDFTKKYFLFLLFRVEICTSRALSVTW